MKRFLYNSLSMVQPLFFMTFLAGLLLLATFEDLVKELLFISLITATFVYLKPIGSSL